LSESTLFFRTLKINQRFVSIQEAYIHEKWLTQIKNSELCGISNFPFFIPLSPALQGLFKLISSNQGENQQLVGNWKVVVLGE
jgi:hypothetical protein